MNRKNEPRGCPSMFLVIINWEGSSTKQRKKTDRGQWNTKTKCKMKPVFCGILRVKVTKPWLVTHLELKVKTNVVFGEFWLQVLEIELGNGIVAALRPRSCTKTVWAVQIFSMVLLLKFPIWALWVSGWRKSEYARCEEHYIWVMGLISISITHWQYILSWLIKIGIWRINKKCNIVMFNWRKYYLC